LRSRSHILEDESLLELKKTLPSEWVVREKSKDYGIDAEVEIFNSKGNYTGFVFWIQLKATDNKKIESHKSVRMDISKIAQLARYELPVAIFRYNSLNRTFYFEWISRFAYLSSSSKQKSFNIQFEDHHFWHNDSTKQIISFLGRRIRFRSGSFTFPIKGFINNISAPKKTARLLTAKISNDITLISLVRDRYFADVEINLLENRVVLNLSGAFGSSIGFAKDDVEDIDLVFSAFKQCILLILHQTEKDVQLFKFIKDNNLLNDIINHPAMLKNLMPTLIASESGNHFTQEIVESVYKSGDTTMSVFLEVVIFLSSKDIIPQERVEAYFYQIIKLELESKNNTSLARTYYNFGGYYRGKNVYDKALHYYNKALKSYYGYLKRGYFCTELAGILFELDFYTMSAKLYEKAFELEPENIFLLATLGDAEFYAGNYKKALKHFDDYLSKNTDSNNDKGEFSLKFTICNLLINQFGVKSQKRNVIHARNLLLLYTNDDLQDKDKLEELLKIDLLNPMIWAFYHLQFVEIQDLEMLFTSSLMQAVLMKSNPTIWATLSILTTYDENPSELLPDIINTAYFYCRQDFISELQEMIELDEYNNFKGEEFLSHIEGSIKTPKEHPRVLRFWKNDDDIEIIEFK